jgi:hypothetical protein
MLLARLRRKVSAEKDKARGRAGDHETHLKAMLPLMAKEMAFTVSE